MALNLSLIIQAVDKATAPIRRITSATRGLATRGMAPISSASSLARRGLDAVAGSVVRLDQRFTRGVYSAARFAGRLGLGAINVAAYSAGYGIGSLIRKTAALGVKMTALGFGAVTAGAGAFLGSIVPLASKFEQFQVILENTEGSAAAARKAMDWVKTFAKTTPYEVGDVMEAFVQLKAYGIDPMNGSLTSLGNTAAGMNKGLMQAVEMLADAQTGEFERLKEFGIKAKAAGGQVTFTYMQAGKEIKKTAKNSAADIQKALMGIFDKKFAGMMDRQSRTLSGMWSNIKDMVANFQLDVANGGSFAFLEGKVQQLLNKINELSANGSLKRWAQQLSDWLVKAGLAAQQWATSVDWKSVASDLLAVGQAIWFVVRVLAGLARLIGGIGGDIIRFFGRIGKFLDSPRVAIFGSQGDVTGSLFGKRPPPPPPPPATGPALGRSGAGAINAPLRPGAQRPAIGAWPKSVPVGGSLDIRVRTDPGTRADVTSMRSANRDVPINVRRGAVTTG